MTHHPEKQGPFWKWFHNMIMGWEGPDSFEKNRGLIPQPRRNFRSGKAWKVFAVSAEVQQVLLIVYSNARCTSISRHRKTWVGRVKFLCIIYNHVWYQQNQAKIYARSGESPKVFVVSAISSLQNKCQTADLDWQNWSGRLSSGWETSASPLTNASENLAGRVENRPGRVEFCI